MLRVGIESVDITPPLGIEVCGYFEKRIAQDIHDRLEATALVADDGERQIAIVVLDIVMVVREDLDKLRARASELTGIPGDHLLISCTHTHQGPATRSLFNTLRDDRYMEWIMYKAADAVRLAQLRLEPVTMGHASGRCPEVSHNRRWHMNDGTVLMHPAPGSAERVRQAAPDDPELILAAFASPDTLAPRWGFVNFALHYVGTPSSLSISADYSGVLRRELCHMMGGDFRTLYANGTCGDIFWIDTDLPPWPPVSPFFHIERVGKLLASEAHRQWQNLREWSDDPPLGAAWAEVPFTRREATPEQMEQARLLLEGPPQPGNREWVYAGELMLLAQEPVQRPVPIQALRIGDLGIVGLPGEIFVEIGLALKRLSPFPRTMVIELANDWAGYIPTDRALKEGSYETRLATVSKATPGTAELWTETAARLLRGLWVAT